MTIQIQRSVFIMIYYISSIYTLSISIRSKKYNMMQKGPKLDKIKSFIVKMFELFVIYRNYEH